MTDYREKTELDRSRLWTTLTSIVAIVITLEQTSLRIDVTNAAGTTRELAGVEVVVAGPRGRRTTRVVVLAIAVRCKFGLDGGRVDAVCMQTLAHLSGQTHVALGALAFDFGVDLDMDRRHDFGVAQLPHMQVVRTIHTRQSLNVVFDVVDTQPTGHGLQ